MKFLSYSYPSAQKAVGHHCCLPSVWGLRSDPQSFSLVSSWSPPRSNSSRWAPQWRVSLRPPLVSSIVVMMALNIFGQLIFSFGLFISGLMFFKTTDLHDCMRKTCISTLVFNVHFSSCSSLQQTCVRWKGSCPSIRGFSLIGAQFFFFFFYMFYYILIYLYSRNCLVWFAVLWCSNTCSVPGFH